MKRLIINTVQDMNDERELYHWYNVDLTEMWKNWRQKGRIPFLPKDLLEGQVVEIDVFADNGAHMRLEIWYGEEENIGSEENPEGQEPEKKREGEDSPRTH